MAKSFAEFWTEQEGYVCETIESDDPLPVLKLIIENSWLQSQVLQRQEMLKIAKKFIEEREASTEHVNKVNEVLDGLIAMAEGLAKKNDSQ